MDLYYVGSGSLWSDSTAWDIAPGGPGGWGPPGPGDRAIFDSSSTDVGFDSDVTVDEIVMDATYGPWREIQLYGWTLHVGIITIASGIIDNEVGGPGTIAAGNINMSGGVIKSGNCNVANDLVQAGGVVNLTAGGSLAVGRDLTQNGGTFNGGNVPASVARNLALNAGIFNSTSGNLSLAGNFTKGGGGTFNHNGGKVTFTNAGLVSVISSVGLATFNDLTFGASKTHRFTAANSFRVNGTLASNGGIGTQAVLVSGTPGTYWNLRLAGASALADKTNITDCDASSGVNVSAIGSANGGHNLNITFALAPPVPPVDFPVAPTIPEIKTSWFAQYDLEPAMLRAWNPVGQWGFFNAQPLYANAGYFGNGFGAPPALNDSIEFRLVMTKGRYLFRLWAATGPDCGSILVTMNGYPVTANPESLYSAGLVKSYIVTALNNNRIVVPDGPQTLVITVNGKDGASSDYYVRLYGIQFAPYLPGV